MVAAGDIDMGFSFVGQIPHSVRFLTEISAPIGVVMRADHPLANRLAIEFEEAGANPILTQSGPLPRRRRCRCRLCDLQEPPGAKLESN